MPLNLVLVMEDALAQVGLAGVLTREGLTVHTATLTEVADVVRQVGAEVVLTDVGLPDVDVPAVALVVGAVEASDALRNGAAGVVGRTADGRRLSAAVRAAAAGLHVIDGEFPDLLRVPDIDPPDVPLTPREQEVLERLAEGWSNARIAKDLTVAERTVKFHVNALMGKLGAKTRTDVVVRAARAGVLWL